MVNDKLFLASIKLVQDKLLSGSPEARNLENSSDQDDNNIRLLPLKKSKKLKIETINEKSANSKLSSILTKLALKIKQDIEIKKVFILKTS